MYYIELGYNLQSKLARALKAQTSPPHQRGDVVPDSVPKLRALAHPRPQLSARTPVHFSSKKTKLSSPNFSSFPSKNHDIFIKPTFFRTSIVVLKANCQHLLQMPRIEITCPIGQKGAIQGSVLQKTKYKDKF